MPSQSQVLQTRAIIHEQVTAIGNLKEAHQVQKGLTDELKIQLGIARRALFAQLASIAPVGRMPPEILTLIFMAHVCDNLQSPWTLMQVSRKWRSAALISRRIWARIILTPSNWLRSETGPRSRSFEGMEICITEPQLIRALNRAGVTPLDLKLMVLLGAPKSRGTYRIGTERVIKEQYELRLLLDAIPKHLEKPHICSLQISTFSSFRFPETAFGVFDRFSFTGIQSLKLDSHYPKIIKKLANEATQPYILHLPTESLEGIKPCKWWDRVDELSTMEYYHNFEAVIDIRPILLTATSLTSLSLSRAGITSDESHVYGHEAFNLPLLTHLHLTSSRVFWPFRCPGLTHLEIYHIPTGIEEPPERSILLPRLVELVCCAEPEFFHCCRAFEAPVLRRLELLVVGRKAVGEHGLKALWPLAAASPSSLSPTIEPVIFKLYLTTIDSVWLARILAERMAVEEFISDIVSITGAFFEGLMPTRSTNAKHAIDNGRGATQRKAAVSDSSWHVGCPRLKRLVIDLYRGAPNRERKMEGDRLMNSARKLVAMRSVAGAPLEKLSIRFNKEEDWNELVDGSTNAGIQ
jgi:F-box-like